MRLMLAAMAGLACGPEVRMPLLETGGANTMAEAIPASPWKSSNRTGPDPSSPLRPTLLPSPPPPPRRPQFDKWWWGRRKGREGAEARFPAPPLDAYLFLTSERCRTTAFASHASDAFPNTPTILLTMSSLNNCSR